MMDEKYEILLSKSTLLLAEDDIQTLYVHDYLTGEKLEASKAVYVFGSRIIGPHGDDLIPVADETKAKIRFSPINGSIKG